MSACRHGRDGSGPAIPEHPGEQDLAAYILGQMPAGDMARIGSHLADCGSCSRMRRELAPLIEALATFSLAEGELESTHVVHGAIVRGWVSRKGRSYTARIAGPATDVSRAADTPEAAAIEVGRAFRELYPGHACSEECRFRSRPSGPTRGRKPR